MCDYILTYGDFDVWYKPCEKCGYDSGKSSNKTDRCWKCGNKLYRDFTHRALKPIVKKVIELIHKRRINDRKRH